MKNLALAIVVVIVLGAGVYLAADYLARTRDANVDPNTISDVRDDSPPNNSDDQVGYKVEEVVRGLYVPWSIAFTSEDRVLVNERNGNIRVIEGGELLEAPLFTFEDVSEQSEAGLMGLTVDPNYEDNKYLYVCYAYAADGGLRDKIVRLVDEGDSARVDKILLEDFPAAEVHAGCRIKFGPDGKLYVTTGDSAERQLAQDLGSLAGKILRMNSDGSIPADNPFEGSYVYSYGHRNPQGLSWNNETRQMFETEHGPSGFDGPQGGDEVNIIMPGKNYGWPEVSHEESADGMEDPKWVFTPAVAPASALVYSGRLFPQFESNLFFGGLVGTGLYRVTFDGTEAASAEKVAEVDFGRIRDVVESPSGEIWFSTSNRDGRGQIREGDDKIYSLVVAD